ncbi:hypothetical protein DRN75_00425 [Nanoarchaeota archaeon]|nr:MAG: hypothetical protein DRN75_00425 [Nanoarchaeota archaeon]
MSSKSTKGRKCPVCGKRTVFYDKGSREYICKSCGTVISEDTIDFGKEWREFGDSSGTSRRRTGAPIESSRHDLGVSTKIGRASDYKNIQKGTRRIYSRIIKWQNRTSSATERNLKQALSELKRVCSFLDIPKTIQEEASKIYRMAAEKQLVRGRSMESVVAGALYAASRNYGLPRTLNEIAQAFPLEKKEIGKTYRFISRQLGLRIIPTLPMDYVHRFASELKLSPETTAKAVEIIKKAQNKEVTSGKGPMGIAAAAIYVATLLTGEKKTQREVADVAGVTEVTIRNRYKELITKLNLEKQIKSSE